MSAQSDQAIRESISEDRIVHLPWDMPLEVDLLAASDGTARAGDVLEFWGTTDDGDDWRVILCNFSRRTHGQIGQR